MFKKEMLELLKDIDDEGSIDEVLTQTDLYKSSLSLDNFKNLIATNKEFKSFMDSEKDKHAEKAKTTALENFKLKDMQTLIEAEVLKRTGKNETPEQKALRELQEKFEKLEKEKARAEKISKYKDILNEKKIPSKIGEFLLNSDDEDVINANITLFEEQIKPYIDDKVNIRLSDSSHNPPDGNGGNGITKEQFMKMSYKERVDLKEKSPTLYEDLSKNI